MSNTPTLIPREVLFGNPERTSPRLSPDGTHVAYLAPEEGVLNCWTCTIDFRDGRVVTKDRGRGIQTFFWAHDNRHILYLQDADGDENWGLYSVNLETNKIRNLTPFKDVRVNEIFTDPNFPDDVLLSLNHRNPEIFDLYRLQLTTGEVRLEVENPGNYVNWLTDNEFFVRGATAALPEGGFQLLISPAPGEDFRLCLTWGPEDNGSCLGFTPDGEHLYIEDNLESDTTELYSIDLKAQNKKVLSRNERVDLGPVIIHPTRHHVQAVGSSLDRLNWKVFDASIAEDFAVLEKVQTGDLNLVSRDLADRRWLVAYSADQEAVMYYLYDREKREAVYLFSNRSDLGKYTLAPMKPLEIRARDGLILHSYLTLPTGVEAKHLPLVLNVHGGPWARDSWGYDPEAQWLANRGYSVLQVNYRGSTGFGKQFMNAGNREWGAKMHDDLLDAVDWAISEGVADRERVCIYGGSYGGYAALVGAAFTPEVFCCAVDIVGPSNICTLIESVPPYWKPLLSVFRVRVGNLETERDFLESRSPLFQVARISIPMLIAQGANDPRVKQAESEQVVAILRAKGKDFEYLLYDDEGHGFARPGNRMAFYAAAEEFLSRHLGGRNEPADQKEMEILNRVRTKFS